MKIPPVYRFGEFELRPATCQLVRRGRPVAIQPKPLALLTYLIEHRDRVVPREELLSEVWPGVRVNPQALGFALHTVRRAMGDDGERQAVIRTVPRAGIRFALEVEEVPVEAPPGAPATEAAVSASGRAMSSAGLFLGRERVEEEARALLDEVRAGEGRVLLLSGEAGIGKTRALERVAELATAEGFRVLHGRCVESEGAPAFWPWVQILRAAMSEDPPSGLLRVLGEGAREVAWMVPELRPYAADLPQAPTVDARSARFLLFDSVTTFLRELVSETPLVLCIDDLHRADAASAALFQHVARELPALRLALVATYRDNELRAAPALAETVAETHVLPRCRHESLLGFDDDDLEEFVERVAGRKPSPLAVSDLQEATNGNPFFVGQIISVLAGEGRLGDLESSQFLEFEIPQHVQEVIRRQFLLLPDEVREVLEAATIIGRDFSLTELEALAERRSDVVALLSAAVRSDVVAECAEAPGRFRFVHALVRDAIYSGLRMEARAREHSTLARLLERDSPPYPTSRSAEIAYHYSRSLDADALGKAVEFYRRAAQWSAERGALEDVVRHLDRALALVPSDASASEADRSRLLLDLGDALTNVGDRRRAREVLQDAADIAMKAGLHEELALAALGYAPDFLAIETGVYDEELVRLLRRAIESLDARAPATRARLLARLALALHWGNAAGAIDDLCSEALQEVSEAGDEDAALYVGTAVSLAGYSVDEPVRYLTAPERGAVVGSSSSDMISRMLRITSLLLLGRVGEVDAEVVEFSDAAGSLRNPQASWYADLMRATRALMEGRFPDAEALRFRYLAHGMKLGDRNALQSFMIQAAMTTADLGGVERVEAEVRGMVRAFPRLVGWKSGFVLLLAEAGRLDEARRELRGVVAEGVLERPKRNEWYGTVGTLALATGILREPVVARKLYDIVLPHRDQFAVIGYCSYCFGSTQRLLGVLASAMDHPKVAAEHFELALASNLEAGAQACAAQTCFEYARALAWSGERGRAAELASRGAELAGSLGMPRLVEKLERVSA